MSAPRIIRVSSTHKTQKDLILDIDYLTKTEAEEQLARLDPGYSVLFFDADKYSKKPGFFLSFKFKSVIYHRRLANLKIEKVTRNDNGMKEVAVDIKVIKFLQNDVLPFREKLFYFILAMVKNKNWIEKELASNKEREKRLLDWMNEMDFKEFMIYLMSAHSQQEKSMAGRGDIVIYKKDRKGEGGYSIKELLIDTEHCRFCFINNLGQPEEFREDIRDDFNKILFDFLKVDASRSFLVKKTLGYDKSELDVLFNLQVARPIITTVIDSKGKIELLSQMDLLLDMCGIDATTNSEYLGEVMDCLNQISSAISTPDDPEAEKMDWIKRGVFQSLLKIFPHCGLEQQHEMFNLNLKVCEALFANNLQSSRIFYNTVWNFINEKFSDKKCCSLVFHALTVLVPKSNILASIFMSDSGIPRLVKAYKQLVMGEQGRLQIASSFLQNSDTKSTKSSILTTWQSRTTFKDEIPSTEDLTKHTPREQTLGEIFARGESKEIKPVEESRKVSTWYQTTEDPPKPSFLAPIDLSSNVKRSNFVVKSKMTPEEQMKDLGKRLGESCISADLATLLSFKAKHEREKESRNRRRTTIQTSPIVQTIPERSNSWINKGLRVPNPRIVNEVAQDYGVVMQIQIFRLLAIIMNLLGRFIEIESNPVGEQNIQKEDSVLKADIDFIKQNVKCPVNLVFSVILNSYRGISTKQNSHEFMASGKMIMASIADSIELCHREGWYKIGKQFPAIILPNFRKKIDLLLFRIHSRLVSAVQIDDLSEITDQLILLGDYLESSRTRVMPCQVVDVCFDILLQIKYWLVRQPFIEHILLTKALFRVFDEIAEQNQEFVNLNTMLLTILIHKDATAQYFQSYTQYVLTRKTGTTQFTITRATPRVMLLTRAQSKPRIATSPEIHISSTQVEVNMTEFLSKDENRDYLEKLQAGAIRHYLTVVKMICFEYSPIADTNTIETLLSLIKKLSFLTCPDGIFQKLLATETVSFEIKKLCLKVLIKILSIREKNLPLFSTEYIDSYITFHYLQFLKLYNNDSISPQTLVLCRQHLRILISFARSKNEAIKQKFYQLRVMHFLVHEVNLEYEAPLIAKNLIETKKKKETELAAQALAKAEAAKLASKKEKKK